MPTCEDYPCCGHGPPPHGDGGGCPDEQGRFNCVLCGGLLARGASSSICLECSSGRRPCKRCGLPFMECECEDEVEFGGGW